MKVTLGLLHDAMLKISLLTSVPRDLRKTEFMNKSLKLSYVATCYDFKRFQTQNHAELFYLEF